MVPDRSPDQETNLSQKAEKDTTWKKEFYVIYFLSNFSGLIQESCYDLLVELREKSPLWIVLCAKIVHIQVSYRKHSCFSAFVSD